MKRLQTPKQQRKAHRLAVQSAVTDKTVLNLAKAHNRMTWWFRGAALLAVVEALGLVMLAAK